MTIKSKLVTDEEARQLARSKRLARTDMHTLLEGEVAKLEALSNSELQKIKDDSSMSSMTRAAAEKVLRKRLDPEDQDTVEV